jgi:pSer/pThr/pTyr-binding forkhead associated (FHA) protein
MSGLASPGPMPAASPSIPNTTGRPRLTLVFNNQRYPVDKDKFIIGRGSTMTDLTIRDGNISRKHAAVIFRNGAYYIKDLDSTNGIDFKGNRIDSKRVEEGDLFTICDYEIRFTYQ